MHHRLPTILGIDIGSVSTNLVLIDEKKRVLSKRYLRTQSKPLKMVQIGLQEIYDEIGDRVEMVPLEGATS